MHQTGVRGGKLKEADMLDAIFTLGQLACLAGLAYGAWLSTCDTAAFSRRISAVLFAIKAHGGSAAISRAS